MNNSGLIKLAQIALLAKQTKQGTQGEPPTSNELADMLDGRLDFKRKQQVISHLNRNPEAYSLWIALVEARHCATRQKDAKPSKLDQLLARLSSVFDSMYTLPSLAASLCVVVILAFLPNMDESEDSWQTVTSQFGDIELNKTEQQLIGLVSAVAQDCENLMASKSHRQEYRQMLKTYQSQGALPDDIKLTLSNGIFVSMEKTCNFNQSLLIELDG